MAGLRFRFALRTTHDSLGRYLATALQPMGFDGVPDHWYSLVPDSDGTVRVFLDTSLLIICGNVVHAAQWLLWHVNHMAVASVAGEHTVLHAGGVQWEELGVILPGRSGAGKSTLVAGLVEAGFAYHSDEVVALAHDGNTMIPYPKPITLKAGSHAAVPRWRPAHQEGWDDVAGDHWLVDPEIVRPGATGRPCRPDVVVAPRFRQGARTSLEAMSVTDALVELVTNSVHHRADNTDHVRVLADLARRSRCYRLEFGDLAEACEVVMDVVS